MGVAPPTGRLRIDSDRFQSRGEAMPSFCVSNAIKRWAGLISGLPAVVATCNAEVSAEKMLVARSNGLKIESVPLNPRNSRSDPRVNDRDGAASPELRGTCPPPRGSCPSCGYRGTTWALSS